MGVLLALVLMLVLAPAAQAVEVARDGDVYAKAVHRDGQTCVTVFQGKGQFGEECGRPVYSAWSYHALSGPDNSYVLTVAPKVAEVGAATGRVGTRAADGFVERFAIVRIKPQNALVRFFDGSGTLVAAAGLGEFFDAGGREVRVTRVGGATVRAATGRELRPDPATYDRVVRQACVVVTRHDASSSSCQDAPATDIEPLVFSPCGSRPGILAGTVPDAARRVVAVLGSGRRVAARTLAALDGSRLFALPVPEGEAVRSASALDAGGRTVVARRLAIAPLHQHCRDDAFVTSFSGFRRYLGLRPAGAGQVAAEAGGHRLLVADAAGDEHAMCFGVDRFQGPIRCFDRPPDLDSDGVTRYRGILNGVFGPEVAGVDLKLADGTTVHAPTTDGPGYTGRFAGRLRYLFFAEGRPVRRAVLRDADGHALDSVEVRFAADDQVVARRRLAGVPVTALHVETGRDTRRISTLCATVPGLTFALLEIPPERVLCDYGSLGDLTIARCGQRVIRIGLRPRGRKIPTFRRPDGRVVRPLIAKFGRARLWIARLPESDQCGYIRFS